MRIASAAIPSAGAAAALFRCHTFRGPLVRLLTAAVLCCCGTSDAWSQTDFEQEPILYGTRPVNTAVTRLQARLDSGEVQLKKDDQHGWLPSLLQLLEIPESSQVLVFSKTSFQLRQISRHRPRALYFNDDTSVGRVQHSDLLEIMSLDPQQGQIFYTLEPGEDGTPPRFVIDKGQCLICHASSRTGGVPGGLVRSVFANSSGQPHFGSGTFTTDYTSPFSKRWGGWYVTGTHGSMRHMGNVYSESRLKPEQLDREAGANVTDLSDRLNVLPYLTPHSDIVALMTLEHQLLMQNRMIQAGYEARQTRHYDGTMNAALKRPADYISDTSRRRVATASEKLVRALLFCDEFQLTSPVSGSTSFARDFTARGLRDSRDRTLREFDLQQRMFRYPCSWLIHSATFDSLPDTVQREVATRLRQVLIEHSDDEAYSHLSPPDRTAIAEILSETKPAFWKLVSMVPTTPDPAVDAPASPSP